MMVVGWWRGKGAAVKAFESVGERPGPIYFVGIEKLGDFVKSCTGAGSEKCLLKMLKFFCWWCMLWNCDPNIENGWCGRGMYAKKGWIGNSWFGLPVVPSP